MICWHEDVISLNDSNLNTYNGNVKYVVEKISELAMSVRQSVGGVRSGNALCCARAPM
ncbi:hypothetical protein SALWKB12_1920 [Snodgrassella communis]|uniref:Uncharacterized protein n=1 Tax=Snodgrassella communis TaxID=2946699 RepID=A0A836MNU7_9NEIS|nr:hypothetical protein SALWKB12_1920 [Snodgrassella communis]KDN14266.1 hypothetical protein SALWKB29_1756 [Snodgrassella communis]